LAYSNVVFCGAILVWIFNSLANVVRGTGNMAVPGIVTLVGVAALIPLSPCLIFGWGPFPQLGVAGGAVAVVAFYALGSLALAAYLWSGRSVVRLSLRGSGFRRALFWDILRIGMVAALITIGTNLTNLTRLAIAAGGGWLALRWSGDLSAVFVAQSAALVTFGLIIAAAVASGAWFGKSSWSLWRRTAASPSRIAAALPSRTTGE